MRVAIVGASGFVGSTLVERLRHKTITEVVPFIHTTGNAAGVARLGLPLESLDLLDKTALANNLRGITHVVNCSRGTDDVMLKGLRNLLETSRRAGVRRFVHLSSVTVYGDPPSPDSVTEDGRTTPERNSYGWIKLLQDRMVEKAAADGLSSLSLCIPNISGAQSPYLDMILKALRDRALVLLDDGRASCNLVDVRNLVHAIELALELGPGDGQRLFITDDQSTTWRDLIDALRPLPGADVDVPSVGRDELLRLCTTQPASRRSFRKALLHLVSSDVRQAMRKDPFWAGVDSALRNGVRVFGRGVEDGLRLALEGPIRVSVTTQAHALNLRLCAQQLRGVVHRCDRAKQTLGYAPLYTFDESTAAFRHSYMTLHGYDTPAGALLQAL
jgi:nucleoside-diphosphate-sugar epimerase